MLNITRDMKEAQGLNPEKWYEAYVVANDDRKHPDKMMLGRIQARVSTIFTGIENDDLPWAIPIFEHPDGASSYSGRFSVPKVGTKVLLRFQDGHPSFPVYIGYQVDVVTQMEETKYNYPNRTVVRFQNKAMAILDTQDNVLYLRNPGDTKIYIDGNVAIEINGNVDELIHGNVRRRIKGNLDEEVDGNRHYHTTGSHVEGIEGSMLTYSGANMNLESGSNVIIESGTYILENCGQARGNPGRSSKPVFKKWPGVPGSAKGTNTRNTPTVVTTGQPSPEYAKDTTPANVNAGIDNGPEVD